MGKCYTISQKNLHFMEIKWQTKIKKFLTTRFKNIITSPKTKRDIRTQNEI